LIVMNVHKVVAERYHVISTRRACGVKILV
jgi:hypothetical protein